MSDTDVRYTWTCGLCGRADFTSEIGALTHKVSVKGKGGKACPEAGRTIHKAVKPEATAPAPKSVVVEAAAKSVVVEAAAKSVVVETPAAKAKAGKTAKAKAGKTAKAKAGKTAKTKAGKTTSVVVETPATSVVVEATSKPKAMPAKTLTSKQMAAHAAAAAKNDRPHGRAAMPDSYVMLTRLEWHAFASTVADFTIDRYDERVKAAAEALIAIREAGLRPELATETARALNSAPDSPLPVHEVPAAEAVKVSQDDGYGHI